MRISDWSSDVCSSDLYLASKGSSAAAVKQQIRGEFAWDRLLSRNIQSTTNVSTDEVDAVLKRLNDAKGQDEYHLGEIYMTATQDNIDTVVRSEEHTSELQSLMRTSYAVFCLKKKKQTAQKQETKIQ